MDLCRLTKLGTIGAAVALLAASQPAALGQTFYAGARAQGMQPGLTGRVSGHAMTFQTTQDGRSVTVEMRDNEVVRATIDGEDVPKDRIKVNDEKIVIVDEDGEVVFEMARAGRANAWIVGPNQRLFAPGAQGLPGGLRGEILAPADPPPVMLGVTLAEPDRGLRRHFGLEEGKATLLQAVYDGLPAAKAGLKPYDIIVSIDGDDDAGQGEVRDALRDAEEGDTITLGVIHNGQRKEVRVKLEAYDNERLGEAARKYREEHGDEEALYEFGFPFGGEDFQQWMIPGGDPEEFGRLFRERFEGEQGERLRRLQREQSERARELREQLERSRPRAQQRGEGDGQIDRLEDRLERLERMLEKLTEEKESGSRR